MSEAKRSSRQRRFAPFVVLAGLLLYVVARLPPGEPRYGGKPLHYWLVRARNDRLPAAELANTPNESAATLILRRPPKIHERNLWYIIATIYLLIYRTGATSMSVFEFA